MYAIVSVSHCYNSFSSLKNIQTSSGSGYTRVVPSQRYSIKIIKNSLHPTPVIINSLINLLEIETLML